MKKYHLIPVLTIIAITKGQRAFIGYPSEEIQETCRTKVNVTPAQINQWEVESVNCVDRFEEIEEAACFHACILQEYGLYDEEYEPIVEEITKHLFYINARQIENITIECYNRFNGTDPCRRAYHVHKCTDKSIGRYPRGAKHIPIDNIPDYIADKCRIKMGMTKETLCRFEQATDYDHCEVTPITRCYHQCVLTELGYVQNGNYPSISTYRKRYFYLKESQFFLKFFDCWFSLKYNGRCSATYQMYKCMKLSVGEFPPKVLPQP